MASNYLSQFSSPASKLVRFFEKSRNRWKAKHSQWKKKCKLLGTQTRAVQKSRETWRQRAEVAEKRLAELEQENEALKWRSQLASPGRSECDA